MFSNIGLFSDGDGDKYFEILRGLICPSAMVRHLHVSSQAELKLIVQVCLIAKLDCAVLLDNLVDNCESRQMVQTVISDVQRCSNIKVVVLSIWEDTPKGDDLVFVKYCKSVAEKCDRILASITAE